MFTTTCIPSLLLTSFVNAMGGTIANGGSMALKGMPTLAFNSSLNNTNLFANSEANSTGGYFDNANGELYACNTCLQPFNDSGGENGMPKKSAQPTGGVTVPYIVYGMENTAQAIKHRYGFGGYVGDKQSKSYHSYYRSYDARLTRWKSTDPVVQPWQSPYTAYNNNPIRYVDPLGNVALCALVGVANAVGSAASQVGMYALRGMPTIAFNMILNNTSLFAANEANGTGRYFNNADGSVNASASGGGACNTCPQPFNDSGGEKVENILELPLGTPVLAPTEGFWESAWHTILPRMYGMQEVNNEGNISSPPKPMMGYPPDITIGSLGSYAKLAKMTKGFKGAFQAHHLVEVRHLKRLMLSTKDAPSVILSKADHAAMTNTLRELLPYGQTYTKSQIIRAYRQAYSNYPEWVDIVVKYLQ